MTKKPGKDRTVLFYFGFQFFFSLLLWLPIFYEYQKRIGLTDLQIFGIQSLYYSAFCLLEIPTGMFADQLGYRRCLRAGAAALVFANLLPIFAQNYYGFLAHFMLIALARSFVSGASSAYLYNYLQISGKQEDYKEVEGRARALGLGGKVLGWSVVGTLMQWHFTLPYWATASASITSFFFALSLPDVASPALEAGASLKESRLVTTLKLLWASPMLILAIFQGVAVFVLARLCQVNLFQPILESKSFPLASYGLVMAMMTAFEAVGSARTTWVKRWFSDFMAIFVLTTALALTLTMLPWASLKGTLVMLAIFAFCTGSLFPIQKQFLNDAIPDSRYRATFLSIESIVDRAVNAVLASMLGGFLLQGRLSWFLRTAGVTTIGFMVVLVFVRAWLVRREPRELAPDSSSSSESIHQ